MKKLLKIVVSVLVIIAIVFLATGIFIKETTYTVSISINKPIEEVFKTFNDQSVITEWIPSVKSFEVIDQKKGMIGSTYKLIVEDKGNSFEMVETITEFIENKKVGLQFDAQGMLKTDLINFTSEGDKTIIRNEAVCKGTTFLLKCTFPYFKSIFKKTDQESLDNFKAYIEK